MHFSDLILYTGNIDAQTDFYTQVLGLPIDSQTEGSVSFMLGSTRLTFEESDRHLPYHFAINIPGYQESEALEWLKQRVEILKDGEIEIHDFSNWNARALYFYDADGNIVELIARRNLNYAPLRPFGIQAFKEVSEIGASTVDLPRLCEWIGEELGLAVFSGAPVRFCAMGGERALFICVDSKEKQWFPTSHPAERAAFRVTLVKEGEPIRIEYDGKEMVTIA